MKNRKRESCTSGTVRDEDGNILIYSAWQRRSNHTLWRPASEKRQGTKSREVGHWQRALWGFELSAEVGGGRNSGVIRAARVHGRGIERLPGAFRYAFWADGGANGALLEVIG